jgi:iron complex outermembrane receptor protein
MKSKNKKIASAVLALPSLLVYPLGLMAADKQEAVTLDEVQVETASDKPLFPKTAKANPTYEINAKEVEKYVNVTTSEDLIRFSPGVTIRKRFIGDPNPTLGMRGSDTFQTGHTMVFADGMPLHNPLQVRWNGAPRWSMVSPNEVDSADVLYGPFSSQYTGAFGGVVNINTKMPEKFQAHMDATGMFQDMHYGGRNEVLTGYKTNVSAGNRYDKFSIFASYNRLENQGQPMSPRTTQINNSLKANVPGTQGYDSTKATTYDGGLISGGSVGEFQTAPGIGKPLPASMYLGDNGIEKSTTDLFKVKMGYDFTPDLQGRFTIAYEERLRDTADPLSLLKDPAGNTFYGTTLGTTAGQSSQAFVNQNGNKFLVNGSDFAPGYAERQAMNYGLNLKGKISKDWSIDTTASLYDQFKDKTVGASLNPNHPNYQNKGQVTDVDAWWMGYDLKLSTDNFLDNKDLSFMGGYQLNHASLNSTVQNSNNYSAGARDGVLTNNSGGQTQTNSAFSQLEWRFMPDWSIMAGARLDDWQTIGGHVYKFNPTTGAATTYDNYADRDAARISPKASIEFSPDVWTFRYSFSKAYRFPFAEELYASQDSFNSKRIAYPGLGPENGYFHNLMAQYDLRKGYVRANFFYQTVNDEIASTLQMYGTTSVSAFQPIEQTETIGADLTYQQNDLFGLPLDFMANGTVLNKQITKNSKNTALVGNEWVRIPKLQVNTSATYHIQPQWNVSTAVRYRSDVFNDLENLEQGSNVFGAVDEYTFVDLKTSYQLPTYQNLKSSVSGGIDNLFDQKAYEAHPFPQRTYYVRLSLDY